MADESITPGEISMIERIERRNGNDRRCGTGRRGGEDRRGRNRRRRLPRRIRGDRRGQKGIGGRRATD